MRHEPSSPPAPPTWDSRFPGDGPAYARAAAELAPAPGASVLDLGSGTGRALRPLRQHVGAHGRVIAVDVTWEMLIATRAAGRDAAGIVVLGDADQLPFARGSFDAIFAAAIIHHLAAPDHGLGEIGRVSRPGARLAIFHPISRADLAARRGRVPSEDHLLAAPNLEPLLERHGWTLNSVDDSEERYLAIAHRA